MASGIPVDEKLVEDFREMKLRRTAKWMIFVIRDDKIVIEHTGVANAGDFKSKLPNEDCRYVVSDQGSKIQFIMWCPGSSSVRSRMLYASSKDALMKKLEGVHPGAVQANDMADLKDIA